MLQTTSMMPFRRNGCVMKDMAAWDANNVCAQRLSLSPVALMGSLQVNLWAFSSQLMRIWVPAQLSTISIRTVSAVAAELATLRQDCASVSRDLLESVAGARHARTGAVGTVYA
jgi:hypothetical protein